MKGERMLNDKPFRYGGIQHDYDADVEEWIAQGDSVKAELKRRGLQSGNPYRRCFCCGGKMRNASGPSGTLLRKQYPYCGEFKKRNGLFFFAILCRSCAYAYGRGVVEMDGETYQDPGDFNEEAYKREEKKHGAAHPDA